MKTTTLQELKEIVENAIKKHGGGRKTRIYDYQGKELLKPQVVELQSDKGSWLEFL